MFQIRSRSVRNIFCVIILLLVCMFAFEAGAQTSVGAASVSITNEETGFKVGKLRIHPGISLQNVYDSNATNASTRYPTDVAFADYALHIIGALRVDYPDDTVAVSLEGSIGYARYFGIEDSSTSDLSALTGTVGLGVSLFRESMFSFSVEDSFTASSSPQQVGIADTNDRLYNDAKATLGFKPGGGQLRFYLGYENEIEKYLDDGQANLNWIQHTAFLNWELEFFPKTSFFMNSSIGFRTYYDFDPTLDNFGTDSAAPDSMPFEISAGVVGRVTSKLLLNVSVGYGNSFSENFEDYSNVLAKVELTGQFTKRTSLMGGFSRNYSVIPTFSYLADNKVYLEFRQWFLRDTLRLYLYGAFSYLDYGPVDKGIDVDQRPNSVATINDRSDMQWEVTPAIEYFFLAWVSAELGYKLTYRDTDYVITRITDDGTEVPTYYDYLKHEVFLKLTVAY